MNRQIAPLNIRIFIILISIIMCFYGAIGNGYYLLILSLFVLFPASLFDRKIKLSEMYGWLFFDFVILLTSVTSNASGASIRFLMVMGCCTIFFIMLSDKFGWQTLFCKFTYFLCFISTIATILSPVIPDTILGIAEKWYPVEVFKVYKMLFDGQAYAGLYGQTSINSFFISIFLAFTMSNILNKKNITLNYILVIVALVAIFMTKKRSALVYNFVAILFMYWTSMAADEGGLKKFIALIFFGIICYVVLQYNEAAQGVFEKMAALDRAGDISNGRFASWKQTIDMWWRSPMLGMGTGALIESYGLSTHNVYLQVLTEMGILGIVSYIMFLFSALKTSFREYFAILKEELVDESVKRQCGVALYIQVMFIVYSFFGNPLYGISFIVPYTLFIALIKSYYKAINGRMIKADENRDINIS